MWVSRGKRTGNLLLPIVSYILDVKPHVAKPFTPRRVSDKVAAIPY